MNGKGLGGFSQNGNQNHLTAQGLSDGFVWMSPQQQTGGAIEAVSIKFQKCFFEIYQMEDFSDLIRNPYALSILVKRGRAVRGRLVYNPFHL